MAMVTVIDDTPPQILLASENGDSANSVAAVQKLAPIRAPRGRFLALSK